MPDVHVPNLGGHGGGKSIFKLVLEVALISVGVFLGLLGEQWRERAHQRELAEQALRRFKTEITTNRATIAGLRGYHADRLKELKQYFAAKTDDERRRVSIRMTMGISPAYVEQSAWDLALATQSLSYVDSEIGVLLSRIYNTQQAITSESQAFVQAMFVRPPGEGVTPYMAAAQAYLGDMEFFEPALMKSYDEILPKIDKALGEKK